MESLLDDLQEAKRGALTEYVIEWAGKPVKSMKKAITRAAERAGLKGVTAYTFRHTAAVWMAEQGIPMSEISQFLGHTSTIVTEKVYARYSPAYLQRAGSAIADAFAQGTASKEPESSNP